MESSKSPELQWEPAGKGNPAAGIRILKAGGPDPDIELPDRIDGQPVTEIGPYCFARTSVRSVRIPDPVTVLHNGAFYNCRQLESLSLGPLLTGIGSDVFTNCRLLSRLTIRAGHRDRTGLPVLVERIPDSLLVRFEDREGKVTASLFFPEYYEWLDEIAPAHLFSRSINGVGFRLRKAFTDSVPDYSKYDSFFESALRTEDPRLLVRSALVRLTSPHNLSPKAEKMYKSCLNDHCPEAFGMVIRDRDRYMLDFLLQTVKPGPADRAQILSLLREAKWPEGSAIFLRGMRSAGPEPDFSFD